MHPALLDGALHALALWVGEGDGPHLPFSLDRLVWWQAGGTAAWARLTARHEGPDLLCADVNALYDPLGTPLGSLSGLRLKRAEAASVTRSVSRYALAWIPAALSAQATPDGGVRRWAAADDPEAVVAEALEEVRRGWSGSRVWVVTRDLWAAGLWGLARTVRVERPELGLRIVEVDGHVDEALLELDLRAEDEPEVRVGGDGAAVPRLVRASTGGAAAIGPGGCWLVTGGTGLLGLETARWLVSRGATRVLSASRHGGVSAEPGITGVACDVADERAVNALIRDLGPELRGVFHCAAVLDDAPLDEQTPERLARVWAPKARGAWNLHRATEGLALEQFVLFSSAAGVLGSPGQGNYAAANTFSTPSRPTGESGAWSAHRSRGGCSRGPAVSAETSVRPNLARMGRQGMRVLTPSRGMELLEAALAAGDVVSAPIPLDPTRLRIEANRTGSVPAVLRGLVRVRSARAPVSGRERLADLSVEERQTVVAGIVQVEVAAVLGSGPVPADRPLKDLGLDSLMAVEIRNRLAGRLGMPLPATLLFDHPTARGVACDISCGRTPAVPRRPGRARRRTTESRSRWSSMALPVPRRGRRARRGSGSAGRKGRDRPVPAERGGTPTRSTIPTRAWPGRATPRGRVPRRHRAVRRGVLRDLAARGARHGPAAAAAAGDELGGAGARGDRPASAGGQPAPACSSGSCTATTAPDRGRPRRAGRLRRDRDCGSVASGRLSYMLGLQGPAMTVDTACSSSLVAVHLACQALRSGECDLALAGGVTLMLTPELFVEFSRLRGAGAGRALQGVLGAAPTARAGEGCGMLVLKRLSRRASATGIRCWR